MIAFPDFDAPKGETETPSVVFLTREQLDNIRNDAFERGRQKGDTTARAALRERDLALAEGLAQQLQEVTFTHVEARRAILSDLRDLVLTFIDVVLPSVAHVGLADLLTTEIAAIADQIIPDQITLRCSPAHKDALVQLIDTLADIPAQPDIQADPDLSDNEIVIQAADHERHVDQASALTALKERVETYFELMTEEESHG